MPPLEQFHPMLLHFPIVLIMVALVIDALAFARGVPLGGSGTYARFSLAIVIAAGVAALATAMMGDVALDIAKDRGVSEAILEGHEELGMTTAWLLAGWAVLRGLAAWRRIPLAGGRVAGIVAVELVLVGLIIATAWMGGNLVYDHGVNVAAAMG